MRGSVSSELESTPEAYIAHLTETCREIYRVLRPDGTFWLNLGAGYYSDARKGGSGTPNGRNGRGENYGRVAIIPEPSSLTLKPKDLLLLESRVAIQLQADGWWLRSEIIWQKIHAMPAGKLDRPVRSHEYLFLFTKSNRYQIDLTPLPWSSVWPIPVGSCGEGHYAVMPSSWLNTVPWPVVSQATWCRILFVARARLAV
jgi:site-specific DNA-methyltransferase (adenine-specific)